MTIHVPYHIHREHKIVFPVDERTGQLLPGQLADGLALIDVASLLNYAEVQAGDFFQAIGDEAELSGNPDAEVSLLNIDPIEITSVSGSTFLLASALTVEANSVSGKFFEFKVTRNSPYRKTTFARDDQTSFEATAAVYVNGEVPSDLAVTNPLGENVRITWGDSQLDLVPLGSGRWSLEMQILDDGRIEVVIPDGANPDVELRLTNIEALQDSPMWTFSADVFNRFGPWAISRLRTCERILGDRYVLGGIPVALRGLGVNVARQEAPSGSTAEVFITVVNKETHEPVDLTEAIVKFEGRNCTTNEVTFLKNCEVVGAGLIKFTIPAAEADAGTYRCVLSVYLGGSPDLILRTDGFLIRFNS